MASVNTEKEQPSAPRPWQEEIAERIASEIDVTQIDENLRLTPTQRLERLQRFMLFLEEARRSNDAAAQTDSRSAG